MKLLSKHTGNKQICVHAVAFCNTLSLNTHTLTHAHKLTQLLLYNKRSINTKFSHKRYHYNGKNSSLNTAEKCLPKAIKKLSCYQCTQNSMLWTGTEYNNEMKKPMKKILVLKYSQ